MVIQPAPCSRRKKVLVLVSRGGGGHKSAGDALGQILGDVYDVEITNVFEQILRPIDLINVLTKGRYTGEDLYNVLLKNHRKRLLQILVASGRRVMSGRIVRRLFDKYFSALPKLPDLVVSPTPWINHGATCSAHSFDIPFLIIPTDLDGSTFLNGFPDGPTPANCKIALSYRDAAIRETTLENKKFPAEQIHITGFPVKPACSRSYSQEEREAIRSAFNLVGSSHKIVTLVMGALGGSLLYDHARSILHLDPKRHGLHLEVNVCTGSNVKLARRIRQLLFDQGARSLDRNVFILPSGLIVHVRGYVSDLIELMAISDLIITKTGSCTVNEAIYLDNMLLVDNTKRSTARFLRWEEFNVPFIEKYGVGLSFSDSYQLQTLIPFILKDPAKSRSTLERPPFEENVRKLVRSMIDKAEIEQAGHLPPSAGDSPSGMSTTVDFHPRAELIASPMHAYQHSGSGPSVSTEGPATSPNA